MALYGIADLHLSLGTDKPMDVFRGWTDYVARLETAWRACVKPEDTVVIAGDISWAMSLEDTKADFTFLHSLPGRKLILKGNHDYWWTTRRKMDRYLAENGFTDLAFVHNDTVVVDDTYAVCGTRGWFFDAEKDADQKVLLREIGRLRTSVEAAQATGKQPIVFLHYPPVYAGSVCTEMMAELRRLGVTHCFYGHLHGPSIPHAVNGTVDGITLKLISGDALSFTPFPISAWLSGEMT